MCIASHTPLSYFRHWPFQNEAIRPYEYLRLANVVYCCVPCFTNSSEKTSSVSFHKFPKYKALLQKWIVNYAEYTKDPEHNFKVCFYSFVVATPAGNWAIIE